MRVPYKGLFILIFFIGISTAWAQENSATAEQPEQKMSKDVKEAYDAYNTHEYSRAIELLKKAYGDANSRDEKIEIFYKIAECYRHTNDYKAAASYYEKAIKSGYKDPIAKLHYADMLKQEGEFEDAITAYQDYKQAAPGDKRAEIGIESSKKAKTWMEEPSRYQVEDIRDINSQAMDFSPMYAGGRRDNNEIIFTSGRDESEGNKEDGWTGQSYMDLYTTTAERKASGRRGRGRGKDEDGGQNVNPASLKWSTPVPIDEEGIVNTKQHEGTATFDSRKKELYFTKCAEEKNMNLGCGIWMTEKIGQNWKEPEQVIVGSDTSANIGQPSLSPDDKYLYFVSDTFGSRGGHDIFMTTYDRRTRTWNTPKNLGPKVNTEGDEYFPFAHDDGYLYFASNGLPGMGGLDIFRIKLGEDGMPAADAEAENMKYPINTNYDDFGIVFEPGGDNVGFLSSNRNARQSDDIFGILKTPLVFILEGVVTNSKNGQPLQEATVKLEGSDGASYTVLTDKDGYYIFEDNKIKSDVTYNLNFEKKKFLTNTGDVTTVGIPLSSFEFNSSDNEFVKRLKLNKALDPIEEPIVLPNVFFDLGKWDLRPEAQNALDSVVTILNNNPTIVIQMRSHTDYRDSDERNKILSQHRADTCVSYLISKGVVKDRLEAKGMGESDPFVIPENYTGYGAGKFPEGTRLTESYIKSLPPDKAEIANQINRRTDFKVLRDDYVPTTTTETGEKGVSAKSIIKEKRAEENAPGEIYTLKAHESFGTVARQFNINIVQLKQLNNGLRGVRPFEGLQLKVTPGGNYDQWDATHYQIQRAGQDFKYIARQLNMDKKDLEDLNPGISDKDLQPGMWLKTK